MKITAFGDLHLDSAFSAFGLRESSKRREMLRNIFSNIISLVKENQSDLLLISGDLFDVPAPTPESASLVRRELSSLDIPVFITPGNHDYYIPNGIYDKMPENVYVFKNEPLESITVDSLGICVDGYAFISDSYERNPLSTAENNCDCPIHILCAHTDMTPGSKYAPFTENDLKKQLYVRRTRTRAYKNRYFNRGNVYRYIQRSHTREGTGRAAKRMCYCNRAQ